MSWLDDYKKSLEKAAVENSTKQRPIETECPECGDKALIWKVKKEGPNKGRPMLFCQNEQCGLKKFSDLGECGVCGTERFEGVTKGGPNKGRKYRACPNRCHGSFRWVKN